MTDVIITITGIEPLLKKFKTLEDMTKVLKPAIMAATTHIKGKLTIYPNVSGINTAANSDRWYERNFGPKWRVKSGEIHGRKTSEMLSKKETMQVKFLDGGLVGVVGTNVSYAPYVMDEEKQAAIHKGRWKTVQQVASEETEAVMKFVRDHLERALNAGG